MFRSFKSWLAYRRFQSTFRRREAQAVKSHGRVNDIRRERTAILHAALAGGRG